MALVEMGTAAAQAHGVRLAGGSRGGGRRGGGEDLGGITLFELARSFVILLYFLQVS